jgi:hypothetical protein
LYMTLGVFMWLFTFYTYTITTVCHAVACQTVVKLRSMHMWDGLICFGLCSLAWFSFFSQRFEGGQQICDG